MSLKFFKIHSLRKLFWLNSIWAKWRRIPSNKYSSQGMANGWSKQVARITNLLQLVPATVTTIRLEGTLEGGRHLEAMAAFFLHCRSMNIWRSEQEWLKDTSSTRTSNSLMGAMWARDFTFLYKKWLKDRRVIWDYKSIGMDLNFWLCIYHFPNL